MPRSKAASLTDYVNSAKAKVVKVWNGYAVRSFRGTGWMYESARTQEEAKETARKINAKN